MTMINPYRIHTGLSNKIVTPTEYIIRKMDKAKISFTLYIGSVNRIRRCLLTRFVHSDRLSAPARDLFCLYCIIPGKKLPPQKSRFWGAIPKKFLGFGASPSKNPPKKPKIGGILGWFPTKTGGCSPACVGFPLWLQCAERSHEKWNEGHF